MQNFKNLIIKSLAKDILAYFTGLPTNTLNALYPMFLSKISKNKKTYLDWELKNWPFIYFKELEKCLFIPTSSYGKILIPYVLLVYGDKFDFEIRNVKFFVDKENFSIPEDIKDITSKFYKNLKKELESKYRIYNSLNIRLKDYHIDNKCLILHVQPVDYESYLHTNLVLDAREENLPSLREYLHKDGNLEPLKTSPLANNLGINFLVFTTGGYLLVTKRSKEVAFRQGEFCPSASGTISLFDFCRKDIISGDSSLILRELQEEVGINLSDIEHIEILGIARDLIQGGEPEIFFYTKTKLTKEELQEKLYLAKDKFEIENFHFFHFHEFGTLTWKERKNISKKDYSLLLNRVNSFLEEYKDALSVNLLANISFWIRTFT